MKSMNKSIIIVLVLLLAVATPSAAQFGGLLKAAASAAMSSHAKKKLKKQQQEMEESAQRIYESKEMDNQILEETTNSQNTEGLSQNDDSEISLVVSADGATKEEAIKVALRNAIEKAYGTFVSSNTAILKDEMVKDEIVTITNGNIKGYEEINCTTLQNGNQMVTLKATVSISKLISYAKSKGASTEFAGATFAMNIKMKELNKKNERQVLENLLAYATECLPLIYDRKLEMSTPKIKEDNNYIVDMKLRFIRNENYKIFQQMIFSTLNSIGLTKIERKEYSDIKLNMTLCFFNDSTFIDNPFYLRSDYEYLYGWFLKLYRLFANEVRNYKIIDNTGKLYRIGKISRIDPKKMFPGAIYSESDCEEIPIGLNEKDFLIKNIYGLRINRINFRIDSKKGTITLELPNDYDNKESFSITVSNDDLMKISNFKVERK